MKVKIFGGIFALMASVSVFLFLKNIWLQMFLEFKNLQDGGYADTEEQILFVLLSLLMLLLINFFVAVIACILTRRICSPYWWVSMFWVLTIGIFGFFIFCFFSLADKNLFGVEAFFLIALAGFFIGLYRGLYNEFNRDQY